MILLTGARPSEIENLKWSEIDIQASCLRLTNSKTGYSIRPLASAALAVFGSVPRNGASDFVFPSMRGAGPYTGSKKLWNQARQLAGLPGRVRYHARHAVATLALSAGHDLASVSAIMGHKGPRTTLSTYSHVIDSRAAGAAEGVGGLVAAAMGGQHVSNVVPLKSARAISARSGETRPKVTVLGSPLQGAHEE